MVCSFDTLAHILPSSLYLPLSVHPQFPAFLFSGGWKLQISPSVPVSINKNNLWQDPGPCAVNVCFRRKNTCYCGFMIVFLILATKRSIFLLSRCFISQNKTTRGIRGQRVMAGLCKSWLQNFGPARRCWCITTVKVALFQCLHWNKWFTEMCTLIWSQNN